MRPSGPSPASMPRARRGPPWPPSRTSCIRLASTGTRRCRPPAMAATSTSSATRRAANPTPVWHVLSYSGGTLTDTAYPAVYTADDHRSHLDQGDPGDDHDTAHQRGAAAGHASDLQVLPVHQALYRRRRQPYWYVPDGNNDPARARPAPPPTTVRALRWTPPRHRPSWRCRSTCSSAPAERTSPSRR